jgi:DEAD/DEAH box helicase domain-containing protein
VVIIDTTEKERVIGEVDLFSAPMLVHTDAIYIHEGVMHHVDNLDWERRKAYVHRVKSEYYTDAQLKTDIRVIDEFDSRPVALGKTRHGEVSVTSLATLYKKIKLNTRENVGSGRIHLPETTMHTSAYWWTIEEDMRRRLSLTEANLGDGLKAVANVFQNVVPLWVMTDPKDLRTVPMLRSPDTGVPTIFVYENTPGGVGYSRKIFDLHRDLLTASLELIRSCECSNGCPSCVGPVLEVGERGKESALRILEAGIEQAV